MSRAELQIACRRMLRLATCLARETDLVARAELVTDMADARAAVSIARGIDLDDVHPATGYDVSPAAYRKVREHWVSQLLERPDDEYLLGRWQRARGRWLELRAAVVRAVDGGA